MENAKTFFRENFFVLLMAALFIFTFLFWFYNRNPDMNQPLKDINQGVFYGLLALIGVRPRANVPAIQAENIESASTVSGDILTGAAGDKGKEKTT